MEHVTKSVECQTILLVCTVLESTSTDYWSVLYSNMPRSNVHSSYRQTLKITRLMYHKVFLADFS